MRKQITNFSVHQTSKVLAILYFVFAAIFFIPLGLYTLFHEAQTGSAIFLFICPFLYLIATYILFAITQFVYNFIAKGFGGVEFTVTDVDKE
jgi:hypothetical protein